MNIVIIGTGNVAQVVGKMLLKAGHIILQVGGRNITSASECAALLNAQPVTDWSAINKNAEICMLAISDSAVSKVAAQFYLPDTIVLHTSGALPKEILKDHKKYGVLYPLQSMRKELPYLPEIPFFVDGSNEDVITSIQSLAKSMSAEVHITGNEERLKLHIAAVITSNFTNHLFALAKDFCDHENISFNYLLPLIKETVHRMQFYNPDKLQTGPAIRRDELTIQKHLEVLQQHPALAGLYQLFTKSIQQNSTH